MKFRTAALLAAIFVVAAVCGVAFVPRMVSDPVCTVTIQGSHVSMKSGFVRCQLRMPAGSILRVIGDIGAGEQILDEVEARSFPGWRLTTTRDLAMGPLDRTKMKVQPELLEAMLARSLVLETGKPHALRRGERLVFSHTARECAFELK